MDLVVSLNLKDAVGPVSAYISLKATEWYGRLVIHLKSAAGCLVDRRLASIAVIAMNFAILELAFRISTFARFFLPEMDSIRMVCLLPLAAALVFAGNVALIKVTNMTLHPLVVTSLVVATFIIKLKLEDMAA